MHFLKLGNVTLNSMSSEEEIDIGKRILMRNKAEYCRKLSRLIDTAIFQVLIVTVSSVVFILSVAVSFLTLCVYVYIYFNMVS